jgi:predicted negative regulator of RcsB-dependent stress response
MDDQTTFKPKPLSADAIPAALDRAMRYRLLGEPADAESICRDVLRTEPDHQQARVLLLLALTDQFAGNLGVSSQRAREVLATLKGAYDQAYYAGIICERQGKAYLSQGSPGAGFDAYESLREAMVFYEQAEKLRPAGNDEALLRWNTCARIIMQNKLERRQPEEREPFLE